MKIHYVKEIEGSPVVQFVGRAWCALMKDGLWDKTSVLIAGCLQCVFAVEGRRIVGCITFHVDDEQAVVNIAYVRPECRNKGVYRALHEAFEVHAKEQGAKCLINICYPSNEAIRLTCERLEYYPHLLHMKKDL